MFESTTISVDLVRTLPGFSLAVSFELAREVLVLFGPSGAGKSLTLQALAGVERPDGGSIVLHTDGVETVLFSARTGEDVKPQDRHMGYVPQSLGLFPHLTVAENVGYGLRRQPRAVRTEAVRQLLSVMRLQGMEARRPAQLSGGQRQRVALARALAVEPRLLLLDEPFTALDGATRRALGEELRRLHEQRGIPVVLVTHDRDEAFALGDRIAVLDAGRVLQISPRATVFAQPSSRRVAELVGVENVLPGVVRGPGPPGSVIVEWGPLALQALLLNANAAVPVRGARVDLALSASQIIVLKEVPSVDTETARPNLVRGTVIAREMGRDTVRLELQVRAAPALTPLRLQLPTYAYFRLGLDRRDAVAVQLKPEWLHMMLPMPLTPTAPLTPTVS